MGEVEITTTLQDGTQLQGQASAQFLLQITVTIAILLDLQTEMLQNQRTGVVPLRPLFYGHLGLLYEL